MITSLHHVNEKSVISYNDELDFVFSYDFPQFERHFSIGWTGRRMETDYFSSMN